MVGRVVLLVSALLVATLGALLVYVYAQRTVDAAQTRLASTTVVVAAAEVPAGTTLRVALDQELLTETDRPVDALPGDYVAGLEQLTERGDDVLTGTVYANEVLLEDRLGTPGETEALAVGQGQIAASFVFQDAARVASFVSPGSDVAVFLTQQQIAVPAADPEDPEATSVLAGTTQLLLPSVRVIAVGGPQAVAQQGPEVDRTLVTLSLDQEDAQRLILAQTVGELYLGLLSDTSVVDPGPVTTPDNLFGGAAP